MIFTLTVIVPLNLWIKQLDLLYDQNWGQEKIFTSNINQNDGLTKIKGKAIS